MANLPASPLAALIKKAATSLPANTGATAKHNARLEGNSGTMLVLADVSASMGEYAGARKKIDILREALQKAPAAAKIIAFDSVAREVSALPEPNGSTALHLALELAKNYKPAVTLVISDGQPDDKAAALSAVKSLTGIVNVLYCGRDGDYEAIEFMRALAQAGLGSVVVKPFTRGVPELSANIRRLALPGA